MKLIYEITTQDDKVTKHECVDFAGWGSDFIILYKENFVREHVRTATVLHVRQYFKR